MSDRVSENAGPAVSVVLPVFNAAATLKRALDSVLGQSLRDLEVLVVDDGSSDGSPAIAETIGDAHVRCLRHPRNLGAAAARNTGVLAAKGRYVAFIDADDEWMPDKLARQVRWLADAEPEVAAVCTGFIMHREGRESGQVRIPLARRGWAKELLDVCPVAPGATLMVERRVFDDIGLFCTELERFEDWDWLLRYLTRYDLAMVSEPLAIIHSRPFSAVDAVDRSGRRLLQRQRAAVRCIAGYPGDRTFRASLWLERAIVRCRAGRVGAAALYGLYALTLSPARAGRFVARGVRKLLDRDI